MAWKDSSVMDERLRFIARVVDGERMSDVCRAFSISRKTGYKLLNRYRSEGPIALCDRSRRPVRYATQLPEQVERLIIEARKDKPHWGARKIRELLVRRLAGDVRVPATSTIHAVMDRHGLVRRKGRRRRNRAQGTALSPGLHPNDLWCADFKGEFRTGNRHDCYPLTITDHASRRIMACEALETTKEGPVIAAFERLFAERGLPDAIRPPLMDCRAINCRARGQWPAFCVAQRALQSLQALGLVAEARHWRRTHSSRPPAAKWAS